MQRYKPNPPIKNRQRFFIFNDPTMQGVVIQAGPEQSEVKFDNGNERIVPNSWLTTIRDDDAD